MSELRERIVEAQKEAMRAKDQQRLAAIRLIMATLKDKDISARTQNKPDGIEDQEILSMLQGMIKQRQESIKMYSDAGREELVDREETEVRVIEGFLPQQLSDADMESAIAGIIEKTGAGSIKDMGQVMAVLKTEYAGQIDMGKASAMVKAKLA